MIEKNTANSHLWPWLAVAVLGAFEFAALGAFAAWHLWRTGFWFDESDQFWVSLGSLGPPLSPLGSFRTVILANAVANLDPGGFTIIVWLWLKFATSEVWQRALPFIFFLLGMGCFGWLGWTRRRSIPFAVLSSLVPACDPLLLDYATEFRAYSMEFAGIAIGCVLLDRVTSGPDMRPALLAGVVFALFLGSRYSFGLFTAAAFFALAVTTFTDKSIDRRQAAVRLAAFAAPIAIAATVIFRVSFLPQYKYNIVNDFALFQYFAPSTAGGKSWDYIMEMLARNLLGPYGMALTLSALLGAALLTPRRWRERLGVDQLSQEDAMFGALSLAALVLSALVWRWHPWDLTHRWSLWLHGLSAVALVRLAAGVLAWVAPPSLSGIASDARITAVIIVGILALDLRLATHRRGGETLAPVLAYLERAAPSPGSVSVLPRWYPTLRYFYEYGAFAGSKLYPSSFRFNSPDSQTRYLVTSQDLEHARSMFKGYTITYDPALPALLFRVEPMTAPATHSDE
jgi:hypothetical protein